MISKKTLLIGVGVLTLVCLALTTEAKLNPHLCPPKLHPKKANSPPAQSPNSSSHNEKCEEEDDEELHIVKFHRPKITKFKFTKEEKQKAKAKAITKRKALKKFIRELKKNHIHLSSKAAGFRNSAFRRANKLARAKGLLAEDLIETTLCLAKRKKLSRKQRKYGFVNVKLDYTSFGKCHEQPKCDFSSKYRTIDGSCNNKKNPKWGEANTPFVRLIDADYGDELNEPRLDSEKKPLPSARTVSQKLTGLKNKQSNHFTLMVMQWGQFLDHDITLTPVAGPEGVEIPCCGQENTPFYKRIQFPECFPISISPEDKFYKKFNQTCMEFMRSMPAPRRDCRFGYREQLNAITAFVDASNVYGSDEERAKKLREFKDGRLLCDENPTLGDMMPPDASDPACAGESAPCFLGGDKRANEQPNLAVMHTIWMRQHNKIAGQLAKMNKHWNDERIYQESRRIVSAQMQHITYNEFLPVVLGRGFSKKNKLLPKKRGYAKTYNKKVDASISNEFAAAAYRFGHSLIQGDIKAFTKKGKSAEEFELSKVQFSPGMLHKKGIMDRLLRGLTIQRSQKCDRNFVKQIRDKLFAKNAKFGLDLVALNVQRGRDHGLPSYTEFRELCGFGKVKKYKDLKKDISFRNRRALKNTYENVHDIDLFMGIVLEQPRQGAIIGRTGRCIIGEQFQRLKFGDRFFYENGNSSKFTKRQLKEIRKTKLSRVLCDNSNIKHIQPYVFLKHSSKKSSGKKKCNPWAKKIKKNKVINCLKHSKRIPKLNLKYWKEEKK